MKRAIVLEMIPTVMLMTDEVTEMFSVLQLLLDLVLEFKRSVSAVQLLDMIEQASLQHKLKQQSKNTFRIC